MYLKNKLLEDKSKLFSINYQSTDTVDFPPISNLNTNPYILVFHCQYPELHMNGLHDAKVDFSFNICPKYRV